MQMPSFALSAFVRRWRKTVIAAVLIALAVAAYLLFGGGGSAKATYAVVRADTPSTVAVSGTVAAAKSAALGFAASGRIKGAYAVVGQHVAAGTVLAEIDNGDQIAAVAKAEADLATLQAGTRPEELAVDQAAVASAEAALVSAEKAAYVAADDAVTNRADVIFTNPGSTPILIFANYADLKTRLEKTRTDFQTTLPEWAASLATLTNDSAAAAAALAATNLATVESFLDDANEALAQALPGQASAATIAADEASIATGRTNVANAATTLAADQAALTSAEKSLALAEAGSTPEAIAAGRADLENAEAALAATRVVAPFDGVVTQMDAKTGEIVSPSTSEIAMQSDAGYEIDVYVPEVSIAGVAVGDDATTTLDAYGPDVAFPAKVIAVDPAETLEGGVPTYKTTLAFVGEDARIRSGMTANVVITTGMLRDAVVVPAGAVGRDPSGASYVSLVAGKKVEHRVVTTGAAPSLGMIQITDGLAGGETILLTPQ
ncbi:MAG: efflux RND transporter periplasmic adaptor subunit [Patescibacteria group bacterium]|nr:efflux RND transporter periplasmic adaptor subunit [Patescibacteria group bacterium]